MADRVLFRLSGISFMAGSVVGFVLNAIHPRDFDFDNFAESLLDVVGDRGAWSPIHIGLVFAVVLGVFGFMGLYRSVGGDLGAALARLGLVAVIVGGTVLATTLAIDGVAMKHVAEVWTAGGAGQDSALVAAETFTAANAGLLSVGVMLYFGLGFGLVGLAIALGEGYPKWLGWSAVLGALGALWGGAIYFYEAEITESTLNIIVVSTLFLTAVGFALGALLWRKGAVSSQAG